MSAAPIRRQVTLFVAEPERISIDALRARADPVQHALIAAHVTLVRDEDVAAWPIVLARLAACAPLRLQLEFAAAALLEGGGVALSVVGATTEFDSLRARLLVGQPGFARRQMPHITLLHPRNRAHWGMRPAEVCAQPLPTRIRFAPAVPIEQWLAEPWRVGRMPPEAGIRWQR